MCNSGYRLLSLPRAATDGCSTGRTPAQGHCYTPSDLCRRTGTQEIEMTASQQQITPSELDVRPLLAKGQEPFQAIMTAVESLLPGQSLLLIAPFKPVPLFSVMEKRALPPMRKRSAAVTGRFSFRRSIVRRPSCRFRTMPDFPISGPNLPTISIAPTCCLPNRWFAFWLKSKTCRLVRFFCAPAS